jgi:4-amino-4-deoxy-L-arabinose transferase-like glycosyltransferase
VSRPDWGTDAWLSIAVSALFVGITSWWLTQDRSIPVFDAGVRLSQAIVTYEYLRAGHIGTALTVFPYPPFSYLVGALGLWIGGFSVASAVIAQNLVFVPLLALGCYNVGRLAFSPRAGLLAVVFALGSPLITAQFHVVMIDAPEAAMVAVAVWAIFATERFSRLGVSAAAGAAVGLGLLTKEPFAFFVIGVLFVTAIRGGWSAWRGLAVFALVALVIALPWYINDFTSVKALAQSASHVGASRFTAEHGIAPPRLSIPNLTWYFWNIVNFQLYAPLFVFAIIGGVWTIVGFARQRPVSPFAWELSVGAFVAWLGITETFIHDTRYSMPLLLYLAVFGSGWIVRLPLRWERQLATSALVFVAIANTLAVSFGVGGNVSVRLPGAEPQLVEAPGVVSIYTNAGFLVAGPHRDGDVLALMRTLRRNGVRRVTWVNLSSEEAVPRITADFSQAGLEAFALLARLASADHVEELGTLTTHDAILGHGPLEPGEPPPCARLSDGTGVWIRLGEHNAAGAKLYCPSHHPAFY